jgi:hypothetical protein
VSFDPLREPPADYSISPTTVLHSGPLFRIHSRARGGVVYNAFAETFVRHRSRPPVVAWSTLSQYSLGCFDWDKTLTLVDFGGAV